MKLRQLLPPELAKNVPGLYETERVPAEEKVAVLKFFSASGRWTWFATEGAAILGDGTEVHLGSIDLPTHFPPQVSAGDGDVVDVRFFGFVVSGLGPDCDEWGYFSLRELMSVRFPPFGLPLERDLHWKPGPVPAEAL